MSNLAPLPAGTNAELGNVNGDLITDANGDIFGIAETAPTPGAPGTETGFEIPYTNGSYATTPTILFNLYVASGNSDAASGLAMDASGDLFFATGATVTGTSTIAGAIYEDSKLTNGTYAAGLAVLGSIPLDGAPAGVPANPVVDSAGDVFGTLNGLAASSNEAEGEVFELPKAASGQAATASGYAATATVLASFGPLANPSPGVIEPALSGLVMDAAGDLFGVSAIGGANGQGDVFEIARTATGYASTPTVLASFGGAVPDSNESAYNSQDLYGLTMDAAGDLFGVTPNTVFEIAKTATGYSNTATPIASGGIPLGNLSVLNGPLSVDAAGDLFGETSTGFVQPFPGTPANPTDNGIVFEIPKTADGYASSAIPLGTGDSPAGGFAVAPSGTLIGVDSGAIFTVATATSATIAGADGATRTLDFGSIPVTDLAVPVLAGVTASAALFIDTAGADTLAAGQTAAIDDVATAAGGVSLTGNAAAGESIVAGTGNFTFTAGTGSGTVVAGSGSNLIDLQGNGNWNVAVGGGVNAIVAATGNDTIGTGSGASLVYLGSGADSLASEGADTINGGTGGDTVSATSSNPDLVIDANGPLTFLAGTGASTVVAGQVASTIVGGASGGTLAFGNGKTDYIGNGAADTVSALSGSLTVQAGSGGGVFFGGTAGNNVIDTDVSGNVTAVDGGAGDVLTSRAFGGNQVLFAAGPGAETLTGAGFYSNDIFLAGSGLDTLIGGGGANALVAGTGSDLLEAGTGTTLFLFAAGLTGGGNDIVAGFDPSRDFIRLLGYAATPAAVLQQATFANGNETLTLSDGTSVTFAGVTQLGAGSFI